MNRRSGCGPVYVYVQEIVAFLHNELKSVCEPYKVKWGAFTDESLPNRQRVSLLRS